MERQGRLAVFVGGFCCAIVLFASAALANVPIAWAIYGGSASLYAGIVSKGASFVLVVLIESALFYWYAHMACRKAVITSFMVNLISTMAGLLITIPFSLPEAGLVLFPIIVGTIFVKIKAPRIFAALALATIVIGVIGAILNYGCMPPKPPRWVAIALILPLFLGFGLTLMIEGATAQLLLKGMDTVKIWKGVFLANLFSYLFLVTMLPFFPNPYNSGLAYVRLRRMIAERQEKTAIILVLHHLRASNLFLLGLTQNDAPNRLPHEPRWSELELMRDARKSNPEVAEAIEKDWEALGWKHLGHVEESVGLHTQ